MASTTPRKQWLMIVAVVSIGLVVAGLILSGSPGKSGEGGHGHDESHEDVSAHADIEHHGDASAEEHEEADEHADEEHHEAVAPTKGEHGGKLFTEGDYALEVTIFEEGVEPQFRLYTYLDGKLLNPADSTVQHEVLLAPSQRILQHHPAARSLRGWHRDGHGRKGRSWRG